MNVAAGTLFGGPSDNAWLVLGPTGSNVSVGSSLEFFTLGGTKEYYNAQSGDQYLDLTGDHDNGVVAGVRQVVATTVGQSYELSFYVGHNSFGGLAQVDAFIDGIQQGHYINGGISNAVFLDGRAVISWRQVTIDFTAANSFTAFDFLNATVPGVSIAGLDDVTLTAVGNATPIPTAAWGGLALLGCLATAQIGRRKEVLARI